MIIIPAIDLKDGQCVRLKMGAFETAEVVADNAVETARSFGAAGAEWLHLVDLDAAKGDGSNLDIVRKIIENTGLSVEFGGGIRDMYVLDSVMEFGVSRAVIGSAAVTNPRFLADAVAKYGEQIAVGIDAKYGVVRIAGWRKGTDLYSVEFARKVSNSGVKYIAFTDIACDGMMSGPNFDALEEIGAAAGCKIIASGGVSTLGDIERLHNMGLYGAIVGKALYTGDIDLKEALDVCSSLKNSN